MKIVIIGGVAGGATAATRLRRLDENSEITIFEKGEYISFANCGLPYYIGDVIQNREELLLQTPEAIKSRYNIDVNVNSEVIKIDNKSKKVIVKDLIKNLNYEKEYDYLIMSPGATPILPSIPGIENSKNLFTLRTVPDTDKIKNFIRSNDVKKAVVIGGGFIGVEMAENLAELKIDVTLVEMLNQILPPLDFEMAKIAQKHMQEKGVNFIFEDGVSSFDENGKKIILKSGKEIKSDLTLLSIGVKPESNLASNIGLEVNARGGIVVDEYLKTSDPFIFAIGDAIEVKNFITKDPVMIPLAWPANRQGRIVADTIMGKKSKYNGSLGTAVAKIFDMTIATTGNNEKTLKNKNIKYKSIHIHPNSHASYYPGATPIALKLLFTEKGEILGAQGVGFEGVEKRIDIISTAIKSNLLVEDLSDLELSYAPPYSSAKDPVNMLGYVATNILEGKVKTVQYYEIDELIKSGEILIDVRDSEELEQGFIKGSKNIPLNEIRNRINELKKYDKVYVSCQVGLRGYLASRILNLNGIEAINLDGGYKTYSFVYGNEYETSKTHNCIGK